MRSEKGETLIEVLVAAAILGIIGVALITALTGATRGLMQTNTDETARDLAQAQMEYVQTLAFNTSWVASSAIDLEYPGYTTTISSPTDIRDGLREFIIIINKDSIEKFRLTGRKVDW